MNNTDKTKEQLINEVDQLKVRIAELEKSETGYKKAERVFQKSEEELNAILDGAIDGIAFLDKTGKILRINKYIVEIGGFTEEEIVGKRFSVLKMFPLKSMSIMISAFGKLIKGQDISYEVEVYTKKGEKRIVQINNSLLKKEEKVKGIIAILSDITDRKQAEESLREKEIYTNAIIEQSPISIQIFNKDGLTLDTNKAWGELWQLPSDELIGKYNVLEDEYAREIGGLDDIEKAFKGETSLPFEMEYDPVKSGNPGRKRNIKCVVFPIKNDNGEVNRVVLMHEDITEQKKTEEELAKHREHLEELVRERTKELEEKNKELKHFNDLFVGREFRIKELRDRVKELEGETKRMKFK